MAEERKISAGSYDLNKWLYGGYETDIITTIYGPAGSGKTNFCLLVAVSQAKRGNKVIFVDTEGGFSVDRIRQLAREDFDSVMENIILFKPTNFEEQKKIILNLSKEIKNKGKIGAIIVDGMTMLYRLESADVKEEPVKIKEINSELARQMKTLAEIARLKNIAIIVTNQVYKEFLCREDFEAGKKAGISMVGGDLLKYWSKCLMELINEGGKRRVILRKHRSLGEKEMSFQIYEGGIRKRGWI